MSSRVAWYLLAYDVRESARLQRVHRHLCKKGIPVQESVFFIHATRKEINTLLGEVEKIVHQREDDVRIYPINKPSNVWMHGYSAFAAKPVPVDPPPKSFFGKLKNLLRIFYV